MADGGRRTVVIGLVITAAIGVLGGCMTRVGGDPVETGDPAGSPVQSRPAGEQDAEDCDFVAVPGADRPVGLPPAEDIDGRRVVFRTTSGELPMDLDRDAAPCTVRNFLHLAGEGFFDGISCHRLTSHPRLAVLQCGDPTGDGTGGPGYTIPDEPPTDLPPASTGESLVTYPRGTVAMANAGPDTGGSQFFLVYRDSSIPPTYTVFGALDQSGLATLDAVAAAGIAPGSDADDGVPRARVTIESVAVD